MYHRTERPSFQPITTTRLRSKGSKLEVIPTGTTAPGKPPPSSAPEARQPATSILRVANLYRLTSIPFIQFGSDSRPRAS